MQRWCDPEGLPEQLVALAAVALGGLTYPTAEAGADLDALNARILERLRRETPFVPSSTVVDGAFALRACFINPRTTADVVAGLCDAVVGFGDQIAG